MKRTAALASASMLAVMSSPGLVHAQTAPTTAPEQETTTVDEIIVTAQKRSERLQDVPASISALTSEQLQGAGVVNLTQIAPRIPGFYGGSAGATRPQLYIRGIGSRQFDAGSEASVGVFVDEVYLGRTAGTLGALRDVERIEVLKGPQGTLYGRNTIGGAINVITKAPTDIFAAEAEAGVGNFNGYNYSAAVSGPIASGLTARLAGWRTFQDGYMRNTLTGNDAQGVDNWGGRLRIDYEPSDVLRFGVIAELLRDDGFSFAGKTAGTTANPNAVFLARPGAVPITTVDKYSEAIDGDNLLERNVETYSLRGEYDIGAGTFTSITAFRKNHAIDDRDFDNTSLAVLRQKSDESSDQFTQELRFTSNPEGSMSFGGRLDWIAGLFYYHDESDRVDTFSFGLDSVIGAARGPGNFDIAATSFETTSLAGFAQATWHITDTLDLTLGGRYTEDKKSAISLGTTTTPGLPLVSAAFVTPELEDTFKSFDPRVTLTYKPNRDLTFYASYNEGFKSGGFQYVPFTAAQASVIFQPEDLKAYEVGMKSQWLDRRLTFNAGAFLYDYKDLQVLRVVAVPGGGAATLITNAASSEVKGFEAELVARPAEGLEFNLGYAYTDGKYDSFPFNATTDFSGTRMVRSPKDSVNAGVQFEVPVSSTSTLTVRADYAYLSTFYFEPGEGNGLYGNTIPLSVQPSYGLLDMRATYAVNNLRLSAFVSNATDEYYRRTTLGLPGQLISYPGPPRTYGLSLSWSY